MIARIIEYAVRNRFIVILITALVAVWGVYCLLKTPIDAIPDLSENQVMVFTDWMGRSPQEIDDQITYPLSVNLQGLAGVTAVRAQSEFNFSMINIIFDDKIDFYFARQRVLERLSLAATFLPAGVVPYLAPDATALGQIFWYTVEGNGQSLDELRAIQDWYVRYQLYVPGVAEVASVGGFVREYQIDLDPNKLRAFNIPLGAVYSAVARSNNAVGGKVFLEAKAEYLIRAAGWIRGIPDLEEIVVAERNGVPIRVRNLAVVQLGPEYRRSLLENRGEAVGGVVLMRFGENPLTVTRAIKQRIEQLQAGLPAGVRIVPFYDRTRLIEGAIHTLQRTLTEEMVIASIAILLILFHLRSAIVVCATLPLAVLMAFIFMYYLGIPSNIMSLSGIAISIGILVDAAVVMVENATHELTREFGHARVRGDTVEIVVRACRLVGAPIFFAILIMLISFLPVFALSGQEGKMFHPLAFTKSFAMVGVAILAITFVPAIIPILIKGRLRGEEDNWIVRSFIEIYKPVLTWLMNIPAAGIWFMAFLLILGVGFIPSRPLYFGVLAVALFFGCVFFRRWRSQAIAFVLLAAAATCSWHFKTIGRDVIPPLDEGVILDMPVTVPRVSLAQAGDDLRVRDHVMRDFPEVDQVVGKAGRADTPTDPSGPDMIETVVTLRPKEWWPKRKINYSDAESETAKLFAALEERGALQSRVSRRQGLLDQITEARQALQILVERASDYENSSTTYANALDQARQVWDELRQNPDKPLGETPDYTKQLESAQAVYSKLRPPLLAWKEPDRAHAFQYADEALGRDISAACDEVLEEQDKPLIMSATMDGIVQFDRALRELAHRRQVEFQPLLARQLVLTTINDLCDNFRRRALLLREPTAGEIQQLAEPLAQDHGLRLVEVPRREELTQLLDAAVARCAERGIIESNIPLLPAASLWTQARDFINATVGAERTTLAGELFDRWQQRLDEQWVQQTKCLNWELEDRAYETIVWSLLDALRQHAQSAGQLTNELTDADMQSIAQSRAQEMHKNVFLWHKSKDDLVKEMDSELQMPGWGNIWTQPIINRVDMLATGVRTMIGVKVYGPRLADQTEEVTQNGIKQTVVKPGIQSIANEVAATLRRVPGAVDVFPDQVVGRSYLQIDINREEAARYGVNFGDIQDAVEIAMGGKTITTTVEGRQRFPVRVRYARDFWQTEEALRQTLVTAQGPTAPSTTGGSSMGAMSGPAEKQSENAVLQIPISKVADIKVVEGPSTIKSENGMLRAYVQLNVRDRDVVGFVEAAQQAVAENVKLPPGFYLQWSGQFESQVRARKTLQVVFPLVVLLIFILLYMTFHDVRDALLIILAVPGALVGGVIFQSLFGFNFSVAVWVGYIACFGMATQTGIVMLVYLHDAIRTRGGLAKIANLAELKDAIIAGAVHRLRPKLMTEGVAIVGLMPMMWATGVGAEVMKPMAAPVLGGLLVADEVIDLLIPVVFNWYQARRWRRLHAAGATPLSAVPAHP